MTMDFMWPWEILLPDKHPNFHIHLLSPSLGSPVDLILNLLILLQPRASSLASGFTEEIKLMPHPLLHVCQKYSLT